MSHSGPLARFVDRLVPVGQGKERERALLLASLGVVTMAASLVYGVMAYVAYGGWSDSVGYSLGEAALACVSLVLLRLGQQQAAATLFPIQLLALLLSSALTRGGLDGAAVLTLPVVPLVGTIVGGRRVGWLVAVVAGLSALTLFALHLRGYVFGDPYADRRELMTVWTVSLTAVFVAAVAGLYETSRARALKLAEGRLAALERANAELESARDRAEAGSRAKSEFLARVSHEIRTPMHGVIGMNELLLASELDREQKDHAVAIRRSANGLLAIIDQVLDFSRMEAGRAPLRSDPFDPRAPMEDALRLLAPDAWRRGLVVVGWAEPRVPRMVKGDEGRLRQVLVNLIANAVKYTDEGHVVVRLQRESEGIRFVVEDTGVGLGPDASGIFEPFTQGDSFATRRVGGMGLGLAICRELVHLMGGTIGVDRRSEGGSSFWLSLPLEAQTGISDHPDLTGCRVFLLLDDEVETEAIECWLHAWGAEVFTGGPRVLAENAPWNHLIVDAGRVHTLERALRGVSLAPDASAVVLSPPGASGDLGRVARLPTARMSKPLLESRVVRLMRQLDDGEIEEEASTLTPGPLRPVGGAVLVVDDNAVGRQLAQVLVKRLGYDAEAAADGFDALQKVDEGDFDLVLLDCQMPGMSGYEVASEIRRRHPDRGLRIVAVTAHALGDERERCLAAGMDDYLAKPFLPEQLADVLARQLGGE